jgi:hypothetical protein
VYYTDIYPQMADPVEYERRRPGADGIPIRLSDGRDWLLARPAYRPTLAGVSTPVVDGPLDRIFECAVIGGELDLKDIWLAAKQLLSVNYELTPDELRDLLSTSPGSESRTLASGVIEALFGSEQDEKTYTRWVRASLLANGLGGVDIAAQDLPNVLAILVATNRSIPLYRFADACRLVDERARLERLI